MNARPVILAGCGRLGSAMVEGWLKTGGLDPRALIILTPSQKPAAEAARAAGARINPPADILATADRLILTVKPALWREVITGLAPDLAEDVLVISAMAGVRAADIAKAVAPRRVARVMPTTSMAVGEGVASIWGATAADRQTAQALFAPVARLALLADEGLMDAATAVSGSGQAYFFAFVEALTRAGVAQGLPAEQAEALARGTLISAAAAMREDAASAAEQIARVASPGGTTRAALSVFEDKEALDGLVARAADAAVTRARALSQS